MQYPKPANGSKRGVHWTASCYPAHANFQWHLDWMVRCGIGWVKYVADGNASAGQNDSGVQFGIECLKRGMIPIHRFYLPANHRWIDANDNAVSACVRNGIKYIEPMNEPDLPIEWGGGSLPTDWLSRSFRTWIGQARRILALGGIPLSPALASGVFQDRGPDAGRVTVNPFVWVRDAGITDFVCAIHNYTGNHPIDYPYDAVNQDGKPLTQVEYDKYGPEAWDYRSLQNINEQRMRDRNPGDTIRDDDSCFLAVLLFRELLDEAGFRHVPIMTTEGGPVHTDLWDGRYPRVVPKLFIEMLEQELRWVADRNWYYCLCPWLWANNSAGGTGGWADCQWYHPGHPWVDSDGFMPVVKWLINRPLSEDGNGGPIAPPTQLPEEESEMPEPELQWLIPDWNDARPVSYIAAPGDIVWRLVRAEVAPDNMANTVWINVLHEDGRRANVIVKTRNINGQEESLPHKPGEPYNRPLWKNDNLTIWIDQDNSDKVVDLHGAYWNVPGVNTFHVGYVLTFQCITEPAQETESEPGPAEITEQEIRNRAWNRIYPAGGIAYNSEAAFPVKARELALGCPVTSEFDIGPYRAQGYALGIVYAVIGEWQVINRLEW